MVTMAYRLLVADDHAVVRKGIVQILEGASDLSVQGEATNGMELIDLVRKQEWDAVIMDLTMPGLSGLDLLKQLHAIRPNLRILVLSVAPEDQYALRMLRSGASGYLTKESVPSELVNAIRKVCAGGRYVSQHLAEELTYSLGADAEHAPHESLSDREFEVLRLMATGLTPTAIAEKLCVSIKTVSTYRARMLEKMRMKTSAELVRYAIKAGLVD
jgi:two-component system invasion response regulator UvrY